jgi:hypothetical protein
VVTSHRSLLTSKLKDASLTSHNSPLTSVMPGISRGSRRPATWLGVAALCSVGACGARQPVAPTTPDAPTVARILPLVRVIVLETSGPPPSDTSVSFTAGTSHTIVLRHASPENSVFARLSFPPSAFADSGQTVKVDVRPRPGVYGLDVVTSLPMREATVVFDYARYFSAPARAHQVYRTAAAFERALSIGRLLAEGQIELFPSTRPAPDNLAATLPAAGSYLLAAPQ